MNDITTGILDTVDPVVKELSAHITNSAAAVCAICCCGLLSIVSLAAIDKKTGTFLEVVSDKNKFFPIFGGYIDNHRKKY